MRIIKQQELVIDLDKKLFNEVYYPHLYDYDKRFNVYYGGAGSGKSHFAVQKHILKCLRYKNRKVLVVRKVANTLRDSIYALFKSILSDWGLKGLYECKDSYLTIEFSNGSNILFKGLDDSEKIKSITNIDDILIEEATELTLEDFSQLNLRLRSRNPYNQITLLYNPVSKVNWVYQYWHARQLDASNEMLLHTNHTHNKFLPQDYIDTLLSYKQLNPAYYRIYCLGEFGSLDKLVYTRWEEKEFDYKLLLQDKNFKGLFGLDFGYTNDPSAFICILVNQFTKELYIYNEFAETGLTNDEIAKKIINMGFRKEVIVCDSAEPKSIEELRRYGLYRVRGTRKGKDSIINGIQFLQQYRIYVHPQCTNTIEELSNYSWKKDKMTNEYINKPIDSYNHCLDALRYAVEPINTHNSIIRVI